MSDSTTKENVKEDGNISVTTITMFTTTELSLGLEIATTPDNTADTEDIVVTTTEVIVISTIFISILIIVGVSGNVMTIFAYIENRKQNKVYDFFILNLAFTDLTLCGVIFPFNMADILMDYTWPFGIWSCKFRLLIELTATVEATLLIVIISLDRLIMISLRTLYIQKVTLKAARTVVIISWFISSMYYGPVIFRYEPVFGYSFTEKYCDILISNQTLVVIIMAVMEFVIPFVGLTIINCLLFYKIWRWAKIRQMANRGKIIVTSTNIVSTCPVSDKTAKHIIQCGNLVISVVVGLPGNSNLSTQQMNTGSGQEENKYRSNFSKAILRPARNLAVLVLAFFFCWLPYEITTVIISVCKDCVDATFYELCIWLLLIKSVVNPFLYAFNSPRYRKCFARYITFNGRIWKAETMR